MDDLYVNYLAIIDNQRARIAELEAALRKVDEYRGSLIEKDALCERIAELEAENTEQTRSFELLKQFWESQDVGTMKAMRDTAYGRIAELEEPKCLDCGQPIPKICPCCNQENINREDGE